MLPQDLEPRLFSGYPPEARSLAVSHVLVFQRLPLAFLPNLLRELIDYDYKFPAERATIDREVATLGALSSQQISEWFGKFFSIELSAQLEQLDWVNLPEQFIEQESAYLWASHQIDAFTVAAQAYGERLAKAAPLTDLPVRRLGVAVIGQGCSAEGPLFRNLRPHGTYFNQVKSAGGLEMLFQALEERTKLYPVPYGHWYVDGGEAVAQSTSLTTVSYAALEPVRSNLLKYMQSEIARPGMGPEQLRTDMAQLTPEKLGMNTKGDATLDRFNVRLFTEGSGTQIFSTTFAQWTTREALRRAQPLTLLARYAPRQRQRPMSELLSNTSNTPEVDLPGSLVDADMAAYYHWINQQRLPSANISSFLVWFEDHNQALAIGPTLPRGAQSDSAIDLAGLVRLAVS